MGKRMWKQIITASVLVPLLGASFASPGLAEKKSQPVKKLETTGELIVRYKDQASANPEALGKRLGFRTVKRFGKAALLRVEASKLNEVARKLQNEQDVAYVEPNYVYSVAETEEPPVSNDPMVDEQWGLSAVRAKAAWDKLANWPEKKKDQVVVAVVDTGVDESHPDLAGRVLPGFNTLDNSTNATDDHSHGTHVSGIIAAQTDNEEGIAGVAGKENVKILPIKVLDADGWGTSLSIAAGVDKAVEMGADIINMSLGGNGRSKLLEESIKNATAKGVLVVVAAGNETDNAAGYWPAGYAEPMTVASVNSEMESSEFSNFGSPVDIAAPGEEVLSSVLDHDYEYYDGTSMATPHVAGAAALVKLAHPDWNIQEIRAALENTAQDLDRPGFDAATGHGLVQVDAALTYNQEQAVQVVKPSPGSTVFGKVPMAVQVRGTDATQVKVTDDSGREVAVIPLSQGRGSIEWDSTAVGDGKQTLTLQAVAAGGQAVGKAEKLLVMVKNGESGVRLSILDPQGEPARAAEVILLRQEQYDEEDEGFYDAVLMLTANEQGQIVIPYSSLLPKEKYYAIVRYFDQDMERMYSRFFQLDRQTKQLTVELNAGLKLDIHVTASGQPQPLEDAGFVFVPVMDGVEMRGLSIGVEPDKNGKAEINLPDGEYVGYAIRYGETGDNYYLRKTFTVGDGSSRLTFDLDQANELAFELPKWADRAIWGTWGMRYSTLPLPKDGKLLVSQDELDGFWVDLYDEEGEFVKIYSLYREEPMKLAKNNVINLADKPAVKVVTPEDEEEVYQPGDYLDLNYEIRYDQGLVLDDVFVFSSHFLEMLDELGMSTEYVKEQKTGRTKLYHKGNLVFDSEEEEEESPFKEDTVKVVLVNEEGEGVWSTRTWDSFRIPSDMEGGSYEVEADFTGLTFPVDVSDKVTLREIEIAGGSGLSLEVMPPDEKDPIMDVSAEVIDPDSGELVSEDFYGEVLQLRGLQHGKSYLFRIVGWTENDVPIYVERELEVEGSYMKLDLSADKPVKVHPQLDEGAVLELAEEENSYITSDFRLYAGDEMAWMDKGTYNVIVTKDESSEKYLYRTKLKVDRKEQKVKIQPDLSEMKKVEIETDGEDGSYEVGIRAGKEETHWFYNFFTMEPGDSLYLSKGDYEFHLMRQYKKGEDVVAVSLDVNPKKTKDGYLFQVDDEYRAELKTDKKKYRGGDMVDVELNVTDSQGNRVDEVYSITPNPMDDLTMPLRGEIGKNGELTLYVYNEQKRRYDPLGMQEVKPEITLSKDGEVIDQSRSTEIWNGYELELPEDLEPGTYTLTFLVEGPFTLEQSVEIEVK